MKRRARRFRVRVLFSSFVGLFALFFSSLSLAFEGSVKVQTSVAGLYAMTAQSLADLGVPISVLNPTQLSMTFKGQALAIKVSGEGDGRFDPSDAIEFIAEAPILHGSGYRRFDHNVYFLRWDEGVSGLRMQQRSGASVNATTYTTAASFQATQPFEQNNIYAGFRGIQVTDDRFFWGSLDRLSPSVTLQFELPAVDITDTSGSIKLQFQGWAGDPNFAPDHQTKITVNGCVLSAGITWDGFVVHEQSEAIPQGCLQSGTNALQIEMLNTGAIVDGMYLNWFEVTYAQAFKAGNEGLYFSKPVIAPFEFGIDGSNAAVARVYDVSNPLRPVEISGLKTRVGGGLQFFEATAGQGAAYLVIDKTKANQRHVPVLKAVPVSALKDAAQGADYILITHADLLIEAERLSQHRRDHQGLRAITVDVEDIYNAFNHGYPSAQAIKDFLIYAYANWQAPAPLYVTLVGDATPDFRPLQADGEFTYVPTHFFRNFEGGESPSDGWFAEVSGNDPIPDLFIGRLPVKPSRINAVINKIIAYEMQAPAQWMKQALFVADDDEATFEALSDELATIAAPILTAGKLYLGQGGTAASVHDELIRQINAGQSLVQYTGHGTTGAWAFESLLTSDDADILNNGSRLPLLVPLSCANGYFVAPSRLVNNGLSLAEAFMNADSGAIGVWSATFLGFTADHAFLGRKLFDGMMTNGEKRLGIATTQARVAALADGASEATVTAFNLFADPATVLVTGVRVISQPPTAPQPSATATAGGGGGGGAMVVLLWGLLCCSVVRGWQQRHCVKDDYF